MTTMNVLIHRAITKTFGMPPYLINSGNCFNWAWIAHKLHPHAKLCSVREFGGHAFLKIGNLHYDAQHERGVHDWRKLEGFGDFLVGQNPSDKEVRIQNPAAFTRLWKSFGKHPMDVRELNKTALAIQNQFAKW